MARGDLDVDSGPWHWSITNTLGQALAQGESEGWSLPRLGGHVDLSDLNLHPGTYVFSMQPAGERDESNHAWSGVFIVQ
jgi:hypothetical protein